MDDENHYARNIVIGGLLGSLFAMCFGWIRWKLVWAFIVCFFVISAVIGLAATGLKAITGWDLVPDVSVQAIQPIESNQTDLLLSDLPVAADADTADLHPGENEADVDF